MADIVVLRGGAWLTATALNALAAHFVSDKSESESRLALWIKHVQSWTATDKQYMEGEKMLNISSVARKREIQKILLQRMDVTCIAPIDLSLKKMLAQLEWCLPENLVVATPQGSFRTYCAT